MDVLKKEQKKEADKGEERERDKEKDKENEREGLKDKSWRDKEKEEGQTSSGKWQDKSIAGSSLSGSAVSAGDEPQEKEELSKVEGGGEKTDDKNSLYQEMDLLTPLLHLTRKDYYSDLKREKPGQSVVDGNALPGDEKPADDKDWVLWNNKGLAFYNLNRNEEAADAFQKAITLRPNEKQLWLNMGYALFRLKRYEEAARMFEKAAELDPQDKNAILYKGRVYSELKRYEDAL
ncbi:MAG: tetratricopeptide repeat protein, partial [Thermoplasmata archaeon]